MKTLTDTSAILKAIDLELKRLLIKDLEQYRTKENKQAAIQKAA